MIPPTPQSHMPAQNPVPGDGLATHNPEILDGVPRQGHSATKEPASTPSDSHDRSLQETDILNDAWSELKRQQGEFDRHSRMLELLRSRLANYLDKQNSILLERQKEIESQHQSPNNSAQNNQSQSNNDSSEQITLRNSLDEYQRQLDTLLLEKQAAQKAVQDLKHQIRRQQAQRSVVTLLSNADWRFGASLLLALLVGGILSFTTHFSYQAQASLIADSHRISSEQLNSYRNEILPLLTNFPTEGDRPSATQWSTAQANTHQNQIELTAVANRKDSAQQWLEKTAQQFMESLELQRKQSREEIKTKLTQITSEMQSLQDQCDTLIAQLQLQQQKFQSQNIKKTYADLRAALVRTQQKFEQTRKGLHVTQKEIDRLQLTEIPEFPEVDATTRADAETKDAYLQQDLEGLRVRLNQLRQHLIEAMNGAPDPIAPYAQASLEFRNYLGDQRLHLDNRKLTQILDDLTAKTDDLLMVIAEFQKGWKQHALDLSQLTVDPRRRECLELQRSIENLIKDFVDNSNALSKELQTEYQKLTQSLGESAVEFQFRNGLVKQIKEMVQQQLVFTSAVTKLIPQSDFQLDAILHSAVGLTRRVQDRQKILEGQLAAAKRNQMRNEIAGQLQNLHNQLAKQQQERDILFDDTLRLQEQINTIGDTLEQLGAGAVQMQHDQTRSADLADRLIQLEQEKVDLEKKLPALEQTAPLFTFQPLQAGSWPINTFDRFAKIGLGGMMTLIGAYLLFTLAMKYYPAWLERFNRAPIPTTIDYGKDRG